MPLFVDVRQLSVINELIAQGATNVADAFGSLAGVETQIDLKSLSFVDPADLPTGMGDEETYVASISLTQPPYGVFMLTFSEETAAEIAELVSESSAEGDLSALQQSALQEVCNICTSGFIDGLANTFDTTIDMGTPALTRGGRRDVERRLSHVEEESIALVLDVAMEVPDHETELELHAYLVPAPGSFVNLLDTIDLDSFEAAGASEVPG